MATPKSVAFHTLGCKLNYSETSALAQQFRGRGYHVVDEAEPADIFVLNTCSVTEFADRKCRKAVRQARRQNPDARIVVTGCYAQLQPEEIAEIPGVDLVLGAGHKFRLIEYVEALDHSTDKAWVKAGRIEDVQTFEHAHSYGDRTRTFLKVQDGCDYKCAFCTIPKARGKSRSPRIEDIVTKAQMLGGQGVMEVVLTGVNIGDFGANHIEKQQTFFDLIGALEIHTSVPRFRISSIEPNLCSDEIIDFVAASERFVPHFHMPLQSGCDRTLRRMRRRYASALYAQRAERIKSVMPDACIGADVIVGFPGETDIDFEECRRFIENLDVSYLHVFTFSERSGTSADEMGEVVPMDVRRNRNETLRQISEMKRRQFYRQHIGTKRKVVLEKSKTPGMLEGYTDNYIKVVIPESVHHHNQMMELKLDSAVLAW